MKRLGIKPIPVSVIIPMYNAERYLERCLASVAAQGFTEFEAILVDDGSRDQTAGIARRFAETDSRFRLITKQNGGVASARNAGLAVAEGKYLAFVDSDDFVAPNYLEELYRAAEQESADIACCNFNRYFSGWDLKLAHFVTKRPGVYPSRQILKSLLHDMAFQSYLWNKLWRRALFEENHIRFPETFFEDAQAVLRLVYHADRVVILKNALYNYTQRGDSIVHTLGDQSGNDFLGAFADTRAFLERSEIYREYRGHFLFYYGKSLLFIWGVAFLIHWRTGNFRGFVKNLRRTAHYLAYYSGDRFSLEESGPDCAEILRPPLGKASCRGKKRQSEGGAPVHKKFPLRP